MADEDVKNTTEQAEPGRASSAEAWQEVGRHFQALGESLVTALRTAWENPENKRNIQEMQASLENLVDGISQTVKDTARSPEMEQARSEVGKAAASVRVAGRQALEEAQPHLLSALQQLRDEVDRMIGGLEKETKAETTPPPDDPAI
jgi:hypothetical protein